MARATSQSSAHLKEPLAKNPGWRAIPAGIIRNLAASAALEGNIDNRRSVELGSVEPDRQYLDRQYSVEARHATQ